MHRQSQGGRRIDTDDLVAFAEVLGTSLAGLLGELPAAEPSAAYTWRATAEAVARVAARYHDMPPPGRDAAITDDALVTVLTLWTVAMLSVLPRDRALGILQDLGLCAAAGGRPPGGTVEEP